MGRGLGGRGEIGSAFFFSDGWFWRRIVDLAEESCLG